MINTSGLLIDSKGCGEIYNLTAEITAHICKSRINNGSVIVFVIGSTAAVTTIEFEPGLIEDFNNLWETLVPTDKIYQHDKQWHDGNGYSHVRAALLGPSLVIPLINGKIALGTWQQIALIDFDNKPRKREIIIQIMGET